MDTRIFLFLSATLTLAAGWSIPYYPVQRAPLRVTRYAPHPPQFRQQEVHPVRRDPNEEQWPRPKRDHHDYGDHDHDDHHGDHHGHSDHHGHKDTRGVTGPVHTFVKTDKNANYKWGVRHHVGNKYAN